MTTIPFRVISAIAILGLLLIQIRFSEALPRQWQANLSLGSPPSSNWIRLASLGETRAATHGLSLYTQSSDTQAGQALAIRELDINAIYSWLKVAGELSPDSAYPTFLASRIYASTVPEAQTRLLLEWVEAQYPASPRTQWPWLAHAVHVAKHELQDFELARRFAHTLRTRASGANIPEWAMHLEVFLLQDLNELEAAKALLGGLIESGQITDQRALDVMINDLDRVESRLQADKRP